MALKAQSQGAFVRGVDASTGLLLQPRGSVPRGSNLILTKRGSLITCDGSQIVNAFHGVPTAGRGKAMCEFLFAPIGVARYYLRIMKLLDLPLGPPQNLAASDGGGSGSGLNGTYYWKVTALDGAGGETTASNEATATISSGHNATVTWNVVPNAVYYNVYRGSSSGSEKLIGAGQNASQPALGTASVSFTDTGAATTTQAPPVTDTTQQTGMLQMPTYQAPSYAYDYADNLVAVWPADVTSLDGGFGGGTGGYGGKTGGSGGTIGSTPSGGLLGNVSFIPQIVQFVNQACIALGNGYPPQIFSDPTTVDNSATTVNITSVSVDAYGVVTVTCALPHNLTSTNVGACVYMSGITNALYDGTFQVITVPSTTEVTVRNLAAIGQSSSSGGQLRVTTIPIYSAFLAQFPSWASKTDYALNSVVVPYNPWVANTSYTAGQEVVPVPPNGYIYQAIDIPSAGAVSGATQPTWPTTINDTVDDGTSPNNFEWKCIATTSASSYYYKAISPQDGGVSGANPPSWPTTVGEDVQDNNITWQCAGTISSAAPPPPGAGHIGVYSGALFVFDTSPSNTSNGLDGPCVLRMSDVNNPSSWNPVNTAFLDKDDGTEGMGLAVFTITAQGIPPEGSLIACKLYSTYQIVGVFGSSNFAIQRVITEMGCLSPRTLGFIPGFGVGRYSHLGVAVFDGVADRLISPQMNPYLFPNNDPELADITVADANWIPIAWASLTANPAMYCMAIPIGNSGGALTRMLCFDLVLKAWAVIDLPFPISTMYQAKGISSNPVTLFGSFSDGTLQRWQAGDVEWATSSSGSLTPAPVAFMMRSTAVASKDPEERMYCRRVNIVGQNSTCPTLTITPRVNAAAQGSQTVNLPSSGRFAVQGAIGVTSDMFDAIIQGSGDVTIDGIGYDLVPKPLGVLAGAIS